VILAVVGALAGGWLGRKVGRGLGAQVAQAVRDEVAIALANEKLRQEREGR
jgi:hypothetical protein